MKRTTPEQDTEKPTIKKLRVKGMQSLCKTLYSYGVSFTLRTSQITRAIAAIIVLKQENDTTVKSEEIAKIFRLLKPCNLRSKINILQPKRNRQRKHLNVELITHSLLHAKIPGDVTSIFVMLNYFQSYINAKYFWKKNVDIVEGPDATCAVKREALEILEEFFLRIGYCPLQLHPLFDSAFPANDPRNAEVRKILQDKRSTEEFKRDDYLKSAIKYAVAHKCIFRKDEYRELFYDVEAMGLTQTYIISRSSTSTSYTTISNQDKQPEEDLKVQSTDEISTVDPNNISANVNIPEQLIRTWQLITPLPFQYAAPNEPNAAFNSTTHLPNDIPNTNIIIGQDSLEYNPPLSPLPEVPDFLS